MAVGANATQNGVFGPRTLLELTCTRSCDWTLQGQRFRSIVRSVGCMHEVMSSKMVLVVLESFTPARKDSKCMPKYGRAGLCDFQMYLFVSFPTSQRTSQSEFVCQSYGRRGERYAKRCFRSTNSTRIDLQELL